jgi:general secretion pathway protein F
MMIWFGPKFEPVFVRREARGQLPWATTAVVGISDVLGSYWIALLAIMVGSVVGAGLYADTPDGRYAFDKLRLKLPGAGAIYRSLAIARFCRILGTLLGNGVPVLQSLRIAKDATGNKVLSEAIGTASDSISAGKSLAEPLRASGQFPEETVEMIAVAEEANNLEHVLVSISEGMERRTYRNLELFVRLLEPLMLLIMAILILFVMIGLMLPVLQSSEIL